MAQVRISDRALTDVEALPLVLQERVGAVPARLAEPWKNHARIRTGSKSSVLTIDGKRYAVIPLDDWPPLPPADAEGFRPAQEAVRTVMARTPIRRRIQLGLEQKQLARLAGVRVETISRLESGKHQPRRETVPRLEAALNRAAKTKRKKRSA